MPEKKGRKPRSEYRKNKRYIGVDLDLAVADRLEEFAGRNRQTMAGQIRVAVDFWLAAQATHPAATGPGQPALRADPEDHKLADVSTPAILRELGRRTKGEAS